MFFNEQEKISLPWRVSTRHFGITIIQMGLRKNFLPCAVLPFWSAGNKKLHQEKRGLL
jgi:hypothetical protein